MYKHNEKKDHLTENPKNNSTKCISQKMEIKVFIIVAILMINLLGKLRMIKSQNVSLAKQTNTVWSLAFTKNSNGNSYLVSASSYDKSINFWKKNNSDWTLIHQKDNGDGSNSVVSLPGQRVATSCENNIKVVVFLIKNPNK